MFANRLLLSAILITTALGVGACSSTSETSNPASGGIKGTGTTARLEKKPGSPLWNLESVGPVSEAWTKKAFPVSAQGAIRIIGWAVDQQAMSAAGGVEVVIDGVAFAADYGKSRPDVAAVYKIPAYANSGYTVDLMANQFTPGAHSMVVRVLSWDKQSFQEVGPYTLQLGN